MQLCKTQTIHPSKDRRLVTDVLVMSRDYRYWVTATFKENGESVSKHRKVGVGAGKYIVADFTRPVEENPIKLTAGPVDPNTVVPDNNN